MSRDEINPSHYRHHPTGIECIDVVENLPFNVGNVIKYLWRAGLKGDALTDLQKAVWYTEREISRTDVVLPERRLDPIKLIPWQHIVEPFNCNVGTAMIFLATGGRPCLEIALTRIKQEIIRRGGT